MEIDAKDYRYSIFQLLLLFSLFQTEFCFSNDNITQSQALSQGQTLVSPNQIFELGFFSPKDSLNQYIGIWYRGVSSKTLVWVANRENPFRSIDSSQASLSIGSHGNLDLSYRNKSFWSTDVKVPSNSSVAFLLDNGNLVLRDSNSGEDLWQSFHNPGDTFLPGSVMGFNSKTGDSYFLSSWKSESDPSFGDFTVRISSQKPPQAFVFRNGSDPQWRSGPWARMKFVGIPDMDALYQSPFNIDENEQQGTTYISFTSYNISLIQFLFVSPMGELKLMKKGDDGNWNNAWHGVKSQCDVYGFCGPFGVCKKDESPICKCPKGFLPKSAEEWSRGIWSRGCVRRTELSCDVKNGSKGNDGFVKMRTMKLPDSYEYLNVLFQDDCETWCSNNCSCVAYAYVNGIGCLFWSGSLVDAQQFPSGGEDLFLRLSRRDNVGRRLVMKIIASTIAIFVCATIGVIFVLRLRWSSAKRKRNKEKTEKKFDGIKRSNSLMESLEFSNEQDQPELPIFSFESILVATNHFDVMNKLGQGGFGPVYKGKIQDGKEIAVKRLSSSSGQGIKEFKNEMVLISKLQHRNLVRLLGYCFEKDEKLLVYEFMPNKSLDHFLFDSRRKALLNWVTRFNIINGIARGLLYLHRDSCLRVVHRDLKVSNILLDEKMNPKISDFGLARIFQGTLDLANTRRVVGTLGYMSPEYAMRGMFSEKSDVFSFGVLILEIVSGRKNTSFNYSDEDTSLICYGWKLWSESRGVEFVDEVLSDSYSLPEAMRCLDIGLLCVQDHVVDRPTMHDVVLMLSNERDRPQPKQSFFVPQSSTPSSDEAASSVNETTMSLCEGR